MSSNLNPTILAIETATKACSVALSHNGNVSSCSEVGNNIHSQVLLDMVRSLYAELGIESSDLDAVAVGQGPGSFTGLRIGVGVAQGIAYGSGCPMIGVSSLDILAQGVLAASDVDFNNRLIAGIDARMGELYWAEYLHSDGDMSRMSAMQVSPPEHFTSAAFLESSLGLDGDESLASESQKKILLAGNAWSEYDQRLDAGFKRGTMSLDDVIYPDAAQLLVIAIRQYALGDLINALEFAPIYVRNDVAKKSTKPLPGRRV